MDSIAVITPEQLEQIVDKAVAKSLAARLPEKSDVLTRAQVADLLQVCEEQVTTYVSKGELEGMKLGKRDWRFRRSAVEAFLDRKKGAKVVKKPKGKS